ncbi:dihydroxyacetone kinase subunit DhaL [Rhodococcus sp. 114MFTsu3.1]|uniref:dihydroxyacetone kinase subunit DhaL n=1 Tax=Rhodococcus sp. 114MFTsu3.1 TaxID=1172184 RepID=UPI00037AED0B|nr:dihydroxyacetone kinase subunit DhaL [Rhodococcus sp. 114MFTsu3.1]
MNSLDTITTAVRIIADTALENETYFCELDAVAGDGDFGYSLARGFESVLENWDGLDKSTPSSLLKGVATTLATRLGGTSGPIWGTGFLRAGAAVDGRSELDIRDVLTLVDAAIAGIEKRGGASLGDKTLLDALGPVRAELELRSTGSADASEVADAVAAAARRGAESTKGLQARRGRASYVGERSVGSEDPGAVAIAVMAENIAQIWQPTAHSSTI